MLSLPPGIQVYMAVAPVDMRKSFDGLTAAVRGQWGHPSFDGQWGGQWGH